MFKIKLRALSDSIDFPPPQQTSQTLTRKWWHGNVDKLRLKAHKQVLRWIRVGKLVEQLPDGTFVFDFSK